MESNEKKSNKKITMILLIVLALVLVVGGTYAAWTTFFTSNENSIISGQANMKFKETNIIEINNALPMNDSDGINQTNYFDFSVSTYISTRANDDVGQKATYNVIAEPLAIDTTTYIAFQNSEIKVYLTKVEEGIETQVLAPTSIENSNNFLLETHEEEFKNNKQEVTTNYRLRAWVDFNVDASNWNEQATRHSYKFRVNINGEASSNVKLTGIAIQNAPTKTNYYEGETFDPTGMVIEAAYSDGTTRIINDYETTPTNTLTTSDNGITITYQGKVVIQNIEVTNPATNELIAKVGTDGLVAITHPADNTLQIGATTPITEYRYQGANPNNYVNFNGTDGDYRIIGVFPTDDGEGNITNRIKLIKTTSYMNNYWNTTNTNKWGEAFVKRRLNDTYYNSLINKGLIDSIKYYLGGYKKDYTFTNETMYQYERKISGSDYYISAYPTSWTGQIGLMYASDYMYGSADCNGKLGWNTSDATLDTRACKTTNWLYLGSDEWTITELSSHSTAVFGVISGGIVRYYDVFGNTAAARPVQYLSSEAVITSGTGTIDDPYVFGTL